VGVLGEVDTSTYSVAPLAWVLLLTFIVTLLLVDLLVVHRTVREPSVRRDAIETAVWIGIGLSFSLVVLGWQGGTAAGEYLSAYLVEKSLSIDNVFVWALIFTLFAVPRGFQHRVLFWGIFGALVLRGAFIFAGVALLDRFHWLLFVFGGFLLFTAIRMVVSDDKPMEVDRNPVMRLVRALIPSQDDYDGQRLFSKASGRRLATPLLAVLVLVETTDLIFAVDSIPAVLAISREQFIVFSSNAFAILGLRALYFLLADMQGRFRYLQQGLAVILAFVGTKMILSNWHHLPTWVSLTVIASVLLVAIGASLVVDRRDPASEGHR
jgi:tellurite resistance protein TerC